MNTASPSVIAVFHVEPRAPRGTEGVAPGEAAELRKCSTLFLHPGACKGLCKG